MWGTMILSFSVIGLLAGSIEGFAISAVIGPILGIIGAALALVNKV